jgi:hypothetical protein
MRFFLKPGRLLLLWGMIIPGAFLLLAGSNLLTYTRLANEQSVAEIRFSRLDNGHYLALLTVGKEERRFVLNGDQWELDARVIKWKPWANLLGLDAGFRLERIAGRFSDIDKANLVAPKAYELAPHSMVDVWAIAQKNSRWLPFFDAAYGSSVYLPMADGLVYRVSMSQSGLLARTLDKKEGAMHAD